MSRIPFTDDMHKTILVLQKRTGVGSRALVNGWDDKPERITYSLISMWMDRRVKTVDAALYEATISHWESLRNAVIITPKMHEALLAERDRVGIGAILLFKFTDEDAPKGLSPIMVSRWMKGKSYLSDIAYYEFVMRAYAAFTPEEATRQKEGYRRRSLEKDTHIELTREIISTLKALKQDSGISTMRLLKGRKDIPKGLTSAMINRWTSGHMKTARKAHFDYVVKLWREIDKRLSLTPEMYELFHSEYARTGMTRGRFLRLFTSKNGELPKGLIDALLSGKRHTMSERNWEFMIERFKMLPDVRK